MKKTMLCLGILFVALAAFAHLVESASLENFLIRQEPNCEYDNWVSHIAERVVIQDYNLYAPWDRQTAGFGDFKTATSSQLNTWGSIIDLFLLGELDSAQYLINQAEFPYQALEFYDTDTGRTYYMLREIPDLSYYDDNGTPEDTYDDEIGAFDYGWGLYIFSPEATRPIIVSAPHPNDDFITSIMARDCFTTWDANFMMISGTGREVKWTGVGTYTNSKSLSDPTRVASHPFNVAYKRFCDYIRAETGQREFSFQVHSYDWNRHEGYTDNQISVGNGRNCVNLPIRDLSSQKKDLIHKGSHLMIPANTIGTHEDVYLNQYYSVNYSVHDFIFDDGEHSYPVNDAIDLPGYQQNQQMLYTVNGWNDYDSFEPFVHIEMDELPNQYPETQNVYHWFYGWNEPAQKWDFDNLFTRARQYYSRWVNDLNELYDDLFAMDDGLTPATPHDLTVLSSSMYYVTLGWQRSDAYDFETYEIHYATAPFTENNYIVFNRENNQLLASQACEQINVNGLSNNQTYYFRIRALDKNGNYSDFSNVVSTESGPATISSFTAHGMPGAIHLQWSVSYQNPNLVGYKIYRRADSGSYQEIASYESDPNLGSGGSIYEFWDFEVEESADYTYTLGLVRDDAQEFTHNVPQKAALGPMIDLVFSTVSGSHTKTLTVGSNKYASDDRDNYWDTTVSSPTTNYVWIASWQPYWGNNGTALSRDIRAGYDLDTQIKTWTLRVRSDRLNIPLQISIDGLPLRNEKIYIYDGGTWHNLLEGPYQFSVNNSNVRTMTLHWGDLQPSANHSIMPNKMYQGGDSITFSYSFQNRFLIDHYNLYLKNESDSLSISENMPPTTTSYTYYLSNTINMPKSKLYLDLYAIDGAIYTYASKYTHGFVPKMNLIYTEPGWATRTNPFSNLNLDIESLFGADAMVYAWENEWTLEEEFSFGQPYFVYSTDYLFNSSTSNIQKDEVFVALQPGWNFVANPHLCIYDLSNLRFFSDGKQFSFFEMINHEMINRAVYVYKDGAYELVEEILPHEAFYIYASIPADLEMMLSFLPYFDAPGVRPAEEYWKVKVMAQGADKDSFTFGASPLATPYYDYRLDLIKAPAKELFDGIYMALYHPDEEDFPELQEEFRGNFHGQSPQEQVYDFVLNVPDAEPVEISFLCSNFPADWTLRFVLEDHSVHISDEATVHFLPEAPGSYQGYIEVFNHVVSNQNLVQKPFDRVKVFPNPFNPSTNIMFENSVAQNIKVDVFNLRGQKVCTLHDGAMPAGMQQLSWQGRDYKGQNVSSGVYFVRIQGKTYSKSVKMMLLK